MESNYINRVFHGDLSLIPIHHSIDWTDWMILSLCVITLLISRLLNFEYLTTFYKKVPDFYSTNKASVVSLLLNFMLISSFFIKQILTANNNKTYFSFLTNNSLLLYLIIFTVILSVIFIKIVILYFLRVLFNAKVNFTIYFHLKYFQIIGLLILPLFLFSYFIKSEIKIYFFISAFIFYVLLILMREVEIFLAALKQKISLLYIILYLCTLEILPLILFIKILVG